MLLNNKDYTISVGNLFKDTKKFKSLESDPTITRMKTLQSYLSTLHKRNELTKEEYNMLRPKNGNLARAHGLPKIQKEYSNIPKFRLIVDTTGRPHSAGKFLTNLINPLAMNEFALKDSFDAVNKTKNIPPYLFDDGYNYVSFYVESVFTNVPIERTIDILKRIYFDKVISTNLKKRSMKKPLKGTCTKTAFTFNAVIYEQKDGVCMGSGLGLLLANVIMTDLEEKVIKPLINDNTIKFYARYVDDTLLVIKRED